MCNCIDHLQGLLDKRGQGEYIYAPTYEGDTRSPRMRVLTLFEDDEYEGGHSCIIANFCPFCGADYRLNDDAKGDGVTKDFAIHPGTSRKRLLKDLERRLGKEFADLLRDKDVKGN